MLGNHLYRHPTQLSHGRKAWSKGDNSNYDVTLGMKTTTKILLLIGSRFLPNAFFITKRFNERLFSCPSVMVKLLDTTSMRDPHRFTSFEDALLTQKVFNYSGSSCGLSNLHTHSEVGIRAVIPLSVSH